MTNLLVYSTETVQNYRPLTVECYTTSA